MARLKAAENNSDMRLPCSWAAIFHFFVAVFNICDYTRFITDMTSTAFGGYVGIIC